MLRFGNEQPLVLVVDDDRGVLDNVTAALSRANLACRCCTTCDPGLFTRPSRLVEAREDEGLTATEMVIGGASTGSRAHRPLSPRSIFRVVAQFKAAASNEDGRERAAAPRRDAMDRAVFSIAWEDASVAGKPVPSPTTA
jgi:hypothetical protein